VAEKPYPGLRPFESDEADIFFGRETHVDAMVDRLARHRFLAVTGSSGSGKSSLARAGLLEALETGLLASAGSAWRFAIFRPLDHPMHELAAALIRVFGSPGEADDIALRRAAVERGPSSLVEEVAAWPLPAGSNLLILVDQFEELFRYQGLSGREEAEVLVSLLLAAASQSTVPIYVVVTMRSDFLGRCADFDGLAEMVTDAQYLCPRLSRDQIVSAITGPARVFGGAVEPRLVARLVNDMGTDADQLPLMQHALMRLWEVAAGRNPKAPVLTLTDYLAADQLAGSLSRHADEVLGEVEHDIPSGGETTRQLFCLLTEGEGDGANRRLASVSEVMAVVDQPFETVAKVADAFRAPHRNFLLPRDGQLSRDTVLDITHESLIRQWGVLKEWTKAEAVSAEQYRTIDRRARRWAAGEGELYDAYDVSIALAWLDRARPTSAWAKRYGGNFEEVMGFIEASRAKRDADETERLEHERRLLTAELHARAARRRVRLVALACILLVGLGSFAVFQWRVAEHQRAVADALSVEAENQKRAAVEQRGRAETAATEVRHTVSLATQTANSLVFDIADKFRTVPGVPALVIKQLLDEARKVQDQLVAGGDNSLELQYGQAAALGATADTLMTLGDLAGALAAARRGQDILTAMAARDPKNVATQRGLALMDGRVGEILMAQGNLVGALARYQQGLAITKSLIANDRDNNDFQRDLGVGLMNIGSVQRTQGDLGEALATYQAARDSLLELLSREPDNAEWRRDLAVANRQTGDVLLAQGRFEDALGLYRQAVSLDEAAAQSDPGNTTTQRSLSVTLSRIGEVLSDMGRYEEALVSYHRALTISSQLAAADPSNTLWQRDLAIDHTRLGQILNRTRDVPGALAQSKAALSINHALAAKDPGNADWQNALATGELEVGNLLRDKGDSEGAVAAYNRSLAITRALIAKDPHNIQWLNNLASIELSVGAVLMQRKKTAEAIAAYQESVAISRSLAQKDPSNVTWQVNLALALRNIALAGVDPVENLQLALSILQKLDAAGNLPQYQKYLVTQIEELLTKRKP
jgi:tetratricopeptide (TPR) repeat protein